MALVYELDFYDLWDMSNKTAKRYRKLLGEDYVVYASDMSCVAYLIFWLHENVHYGRSAGLLSLVRVGRAVRGIRPLAGLLAAFLRMFGGCGVLVVTAYGRVGMVVKG